ncbi:glycosyltransferase family 1 protein [Leptolyngbyaceae cyanobacterium CCMR0082]|uniref:Glycosyltransferase family 1 protein n=1 Tax=Adonisia turfae CCMR0082 TaxID=2304604 RepID=A0A6M0S9L9_9CYAN|nr:glycosyltransferase family 4 protein [Adonisia turfae]MDV3352104.1 glycosyltransferase family 4 protein [Leptothoe sp. LEGE 181152]NEZ65110.1 glycosyltransferase family 1 protein [Adonisia turfae CCMR0082]
MKILLLHDYGTATGGAELQMLSLRQGLTERGHQVRLFASNAMPVEGYPQLADNVCFGTNSTLQVLTQTANPSAYWQLRQVLQSFQPDVVHIRMFLWQLSPLILPLLKGIPCIYQTAVYKAICPAGTNLLPDGNPCQVSPGRVCLSSGCLTPKTWLVLMVQWRLWQRWRSAIDRIVALSYAMKAELMQAGLPAEVIHNGVPVRERRPPLSAPPTVAYAGRLVPEKGIQVLIRAFAIATTQVSHARLLIAGQGKSEPELRDLATELGVADNITWLGHLSRSDMERQFDRAWVQVVPSLWSEPFGNVTTEAMMRGTAVIVSAVGAQPEIIEHSVTGFAVPPGDVEAMAVYLTQILQNQDLAERMGDLGRTRALAHFSENARTERFIALYQQVQATYADDAMVYPEVLSS